ncbi:hypothetical protein D3C84_1222070 [compost metagenome]
MIGFPCVSFLDRFRNKTAVFRIGLGQIREHFLLNDRSAGRQSITQIKNKLFAFPLLQLAEGIARLGKVIGPVDRLSD